MLENQKKPPLGLIPKTFHEEQVNRVRFNEVCGAINRYYSAGKEINLEWVEEYNELVRFFTSKQITIVDA